MAQSYMGTGMGYPSLKAALTAERKKSGDFEDFLGTLAGLIDPMAEAENLVVSIEIEPKA